MKAPFTQEPDGTKIWKNAEGKFHREDGPAIIYPDGSEEYWVNGQRHRVGGPALIYLADGIQEYWFYGLRHREDGPAIIYLTGGKRYWYYGELLSKEEFLKKMKAKEEEEKRLTRSISSFGAKIWKNKYGKVHREHGPAVIWPDGMMEWCINGKRHRVRGPAVVALNHEEYWVSGRPHNEAGPAIVYPDGNKEYWLDGSRYFEKEFKEETLRRARRRGYGPMVFNPNEVPWQIKIPPKEPSDGNKECWSKKFGKKEPKMQPTFKGSPLNQQLSDEFKEIIATISAQQTAISLAEVKRFKRKLEKKNEEIKLSLRELEGFTSSRGLAPLIMVFIFLSGLLVGYLL